VTAPFAGFGLGLRKPHYAEFLEHRVPVDFVEVISENFMVEGGRPRQILRDVRARYPIGTDPRTAGQLRAGLRVKTVAGKRGATRRELRSEARHAIMYEYGFVAHGPKRRHIPGHNVFVPIVMRHRARMEAVLIALLEQSGLHVNR